MRKRSDIDIILEDERPFINSYSTHDEIKGKVTMAFEKDIAFDELFIMFEGQTITYVEKIATTAPTTGRTTGRHTFLKLLQPIEASALPEDRVIKAGVKYEFPFTFVVPDRLLPHVCIHPSENTEVKNAHLHLPPSFGDPMLSHDGQALMDDMAPEMSRIAYHIRVKLIKRLSSGKPVDIADKGIRLRILPAKEEQPPIDVPDDSADYQLRKEKDVKKGLFKIGKIGRLTAEVTQPASLRLPSPRSTSAAPISTVTLVNLRFDPAGPNDQPPALGSIVSKLRAETFYGATPFRNLPTKHSINAWDTMKGFYSDSVELSSRCISTVAWTRHDDQDSPSDLHMARRPSVLSVGSVYGIPEPSSAYTGGHFWTASVLVPLSLPSNKSFTPSFHSCIVSRTYSLELTVSYHTPGTNVSTPSILLKIPIQISSEGTHGPVDGRTAEEIDAEVAMEIDRDFFTSRSASLASPQYTERPEYSTLGTMRHASIAAPPEYHAGFGRIRASGTTQRAHSVSVSAAC